MEKLSLMTFLLEVDVLLGKLSIPDCMMLAKEENIPCVDVMNPSQKRMQQYLEASAQTGVKPLCYIGILSFFSNGDAKIRRLLREHLQKAVSIGASMLMIVPLQVRTDEKICKKMGKEQVRQRLKTYFTVAVELANDTGVRICFETTPQDYVCLSGIEDCRWILQQVPQLRLVYDTANMLPHGDDPLEYYRELKDYVVHTHLKDVALRDAKWTDRFSFPERTKDGQVMNCCVTGQGVIPLQEILALMKREKYPGTFALEYSHPPKFPAGRRENADQLKRHIECLLPMIEA